MRSSRVTSLRQSARSGGGKVDPPLANSVPQLALLRGNPEERSAQDATSASNPRLRWLALYLLCAGVLMIVLDTTIVTVALASIGVDLHLSAAAQSWLLNAYTVPFSGFLLLSGRLGDLLGPRRVFMAGIALFTLASVVCGLASTLPPLLAFRAVQGLSGALLASVSLSLITRQFPQPAERAKALGIYGFVCATGGGLGEVLGGVLTQALGWRWIFLINVPIGIAVLATSLRLIPPDSLQARLRNINAFSAVAVTAALTLLVYALGSGSERGGLSVGMLAPALAGILFFGLFLAVERRSAAPLVPQRLFQLPNFFTANLVGVVWSAGVFAWFVIAALYLQRVLGYQALEVGLAFVPTQVILAGFGIGLAARVVTRFGIRKPLCIGLTLTASGLALFARAPLDGTFLRDVLPGMILLGLGAGMTSTPLLLVAMDGVKDEDSGVASGVVNTASIMGSALGLAVLSSLAEFRTHDLIQKGTDAIAALNGGYRLALVTSALLTVVAALVGVFALRQERDLTTAARAP